MRIIGQQTLHQFGVVHADCRSWLGNWTIDVRASQWSVSHDIKQRYPTASFLPANIVIFNVRGNDYRLEVQIAYNTGIVAIKWIGTHSEYSRRYRKG